MSLIKISIDEHRLNSVCQTGCRLAELHQQTLNITTRIQGLIWPAPNRWSIRDEDTVWIKTEKVAMETEAPFGAFNIDRELNLVGKWLERLPTREIYSPIYLPETVSLQDRKDLRAWNNNVWTYMLSHPAIEVPLLEIQVLWMGAMEQYISGLTKKAFSNPDCPIKALNLFARHPNPALRKIVTDNPRFPLENKVILALENTEIKNWTQRHFGNLIDN